MPSPPLVIDASPAYPFGIDPTIFLQNYWQKRPLLIRGGIADFSSPVTAEDLAGIACAPGAFARIVQHDTQQARWSVRHGPFDDATFAQLPERNWTLLVQDVDKWDPRVAALLTRFACLPRWRIDDIMISYATHGGSVGAHVDQYDVFLLQGAGSRRWQIDARILDGHPPPPMDNLPDTELRLLSVFEPSHDWVIHPGDLLYLPPLIPHYGVALDPCQTLSVGMRAPSMIELADDYLASILARTDDANRYQDPDLQPCSDPYLIDDRVFTRLITLLSSFNVHDLDQFRCWFGRFITTYRLAQIEDIHPIHDCGSLADALPLERQLWTKIAWCHLQHHAALFCNGHCWQMPAADARLLAAACRLDRAVMAQLSDLGQRAVTALWHEGLYR